MTGYRDQRSFSGIIPVKPGWLEGMSWSVGRSVRLSACPHVFSRTVAVVDTKHGYVGRYNGRAAPQESGAASSKHGIFTWGPKIIYGYYTRCALIRDHHPTEETYRWL